MVSLCYQIASRWYRRRHKHLQGSAEDEFNPEDYWHWQMKTCETLYGKYPGLDFRGKSVLDIGCGIGGRVCYIATKGAKSVTGIDINHDEIDLAQQYCSEQMSAEHQKKIQFVKSREDSTPGLGQFDVVLFADTLEHVKNPLDLLKTAYGLTKPGGVLYFGTAGWYHYNALHLKGIFPPFAQLFFSDKTLIETVIRVLKQPYYIKTPWDSSPPWKRWEGITDIRDRPGEYLNKITLTQIRRLIKESPYEDGKLTVLGFSTKRPILRLFNVLAKVPIIQEAYHNYCVGRLVKGPNSQ